MPGRRTIRRRRARRCDLRGGLPTLARWAAVLLSALALGPGGAGAQLAPETPRLVSPHASGGLAAHWVRGGTYPGDDDALLVTWAMPGLPDGLRLRGGVGRGDRASNAVMGGFDVQGPLLRGHAALPFDLDWQGGAAVSVGDWTLISVPVGITGGVAWTRGRAWIAPYLSAGLVAELRTGEDAPERSTEVSSALDIGLDLAFDRERRVVIRTAAALGDRQAVSVGVALGLGRAGR